MKLSSQFSVPATPERVFPLFLDPDVMRRCIPGCEELLRVDEMNFRGRLVNVVAHVRFNATFSARVESIDPPHLVTAVLKGEDNRLGSSIKIDALLGVRSVDETASLVDYELDVALWGKLGRLGESIVRRRTAEVQEQFVERFSAAVTRNGIDASADQRPLEPEATERDAARLATAQTDQDAARMATARGTTRLHARAGFWKRMIARLRRLGHRS
jgi:carbon monoxide dehydrogenase subunit G